MCEWKFSHRRTCLYVTCHLISHVLSRLPRFHTNVSPTRRVHAHVRTLHDECLHTFWLTKTCLCETFNIWRHLFHLTTHICSQNDVPPHFSHTKSCQRSLVWPTRRTVMCIHCEKTSLCATFWLTWTCPHANFLMRGRLYTTCLIIFYVWALPTCFHAVCRLQDVFMRVFTH